METGRIPQLNIGGSPRQGEHEMQQLAGAYDPPPPVRHEDVALTSAQQGA